MSSLTLSVFLLALGTAPSAVPAASPAAVAPAAAECAAERPATPADSGLVALYASGRPWQDFLDATRFRREHWLRNAALPVPADAVARARALPGQWRLLVVAVDACSDSVNTIPFLAQLVAQVPQLGMRVVLPDAARAVMAARPTPDGRAATPTVILLDAEGREVGCWIERPAALQALAIAAGAGGGSPAFAERKASWYAEDAGRSTVEEVVTLLERAAAGARGCDLSRPSVGP